MREIEMMDSVEVRLRSDVNPMKEWFSQRERRNEQCHLAEVLHLDSFFLYFLLENGVFFFFERRRIFLHNIHILFSLHALPIEAHI